MNYLSGSSWGTGSGGEEIETSLDRWGEEVGNPIIGVLCVQAAKDRKRPTPTTQATSSKVECSGFESLYGFVDTVHGG